MMKKTVAVLLLLALLLGLLPSCAGGQPKSVLTINETTDIDSEIFTYFLHDIYYSHSEYSDTQRIEYATSESLKYAAVNTRFAQLGEKLTPTEKAAVSSETNALWRLYGKYLTEIGVSKDTFFKIKQYEAYREKLRFALYDTDGSKPIPENYIKQYFTSNYVGIKYFYEELYTPVSESTLSAMSESDKAAYEATKKTAEERYQTISGIANYVNSGVYTIDEAFMAITGEVSADISVSATVVGKTDSSFSPEFIEAVFKQSVGSAFIITNSDKSYLYFIERVDLLDPEYSFYQEYRKTCLAAVSESYFTSEINSWVQSYSAVRHLDAAKACLKNIKSVDRSQYVGTDQYVFKSLSATK